MKKALANKKFLSVLCGAVALIVVLMPFHAFVAVWLSSNAGHYTLIRLWKEFLLAGLVLAAAGLCWRDKKLFQQLAKTKLVWAIAAYSAVQVLWGLTSLLRHQVTAKALGYAWIVNLRFLVFFLAVFIIAKSTPRLKKAWPALVFWPAVIVAIIAMLQYLVLPYDFLKHFGYGKATIYPYETINHDINYLRAMSTLRGANPLGAYLVVVLSLLLAKVVNRQGKLWQQVALGVTGLLALAFSFSRSAWIGLALSVGFLIYISAKTTRAKQVLVKAALALVVVLAGLVLILRHDTTFQNAIFHTSEHSKISVSSNKGHESALKSGLRDLLREPLGRGPGTAGPASVYNKPHHARIAENYYIQVGQEVGWLGVALFLTINYLIAKELWQRRSSSLALGLLAALIGLAFVNLLSHAWTDDTLAYLWWGLAGVALVGKRSSSQKAGVAES